MTLQEYILANPNKTPEQTVAWWLDELNKDKGPFKMPDITMCLSEECSRRSTCRRSQHSGTVADPLYQSQTTFDHKTCSVYWPIDKKKDLSKLIKDYLENP